MPPVSSPSLNSSSLSDFHAHSEPSAPLPTHQGTVAPSLSRLSMTSSWPSELQGGAPSNPSGQNATRPRNKTSPAMHYTLCGLGGLGSGGVSGAATYGTVKLVQEWGAAAAFASTLGLLTSAVATVGLVGVGAAAVYALRGPEDTPDHDVQMDPLATTGQTGDMAAPTHPEQAYFPIRV